MEPIKKNLIVAVVIVAVLGGVFAYVAMRRGGTATPAVPGVPSGGAPATQPTTSAQPILGVTFSKNISASGQPVSPATVFSPTTPAIYAVLSLRGVSRTTKIAYVRKYNGKYVDSKVSHPPQDGAKTFYFKWLLKSGQTRKVGTYALTFYVDGARALTATYVIR